MGSRTASTQTITSTLATTYTDDAANRLTKVGGVPYTGDNNGNLTWSAAYSGGARLKQIVNGTRSSTADHVYNILGRYYATKGWTPL